MYNLDVVAARSCVHYLQLVAEIRNVGRFASSEYTVLSHAIATFARCVIITRAHTAEILAA